MPGASSVQAKTTPLARLFASLDRKRLGPRGPEAAFEETSTAGGRRFIGDQKRTYQVPTLYLGSHLNVWTQIDHYLHRCEQKRQPVMIELGQSE
jgi:hypothetical protein